MKLKRAIVVGLLGCLFLLSLSPGCGSSSTDTSVVAATGKSSALSPTDLLDRVNSALTRAPVRIRATEKGSAAADGHKEAIDIAVVQLMDSEARLAKQMVRGSKEYRETSVVGSEKLETEPTGSHARTYLLPRPGRLPLPLWAGLFGQGEDVLETLKAGEVSALPQGGWLIKWEPEASRVDPDRALSVEMRVGPNYLPLRLHFSSQGEGAGGDLEGLYLVIEENVSYEFQPIAGLAQDDVRLDLPQTNWLESTTWELPLDNPRSTDQVPWKQYWMGPKVAGRDLVSAQVNEVNGPLGSQAGKQRYPYRDVFFDYRDRLDSTKPHLMARSMPLDSQMAQGTRRQAEAGQMKQETRTVGGQDATVIWQDTGNPASVAAVTVLFADAAFVIATSANSESKEVFEDALKSIRELEKAAGSG